MSKSIQLRLPECTLNYAESLWKAKRISAEGDPKHSCVLAFDAGTDLSELEAALKQAATDTFGANWPEKGKWPLRKGEEMFPGKPDFAGKMCISSATGEQPTMVMRQNGKLVEIIDQSKLYSGCRVQAYVGVVGYNKQVNKGVGVYVNGILKIADGEHLEGKKTAEAMFGEEGADTVEAEAPTPDADATPAAANPWD